MAARILVVDDDTEIARILSHLLAIEGYETRSAANGAQALAAVAEREFDLVVSDVMMPELDGVGLYRRLIERYPRYLGRVIFITGCQHSPALAWLEAAAVPILRKPFALGDLAQRIDVALGDRRTPAPVSAGETAERPPR